MTRKLLIVFGVVVLAIAAAGCGGNDESTSETSEATPASEWADGFCTEITSWTEALKSAGEGLTSDPSQDGLQTAADDVKSATETLLEDVKGLGAPDTESGQDVKDAIDELATTLETETDSIQTTVDETSGITDLPNAATEITGSFEAMSTAFSSTLSTIESADVQGELKDALEASPACTEITG